MCKHVLNAQVSIRAPCCKKWFDCPKCHEESSDHPLQRTVELHFACKKCKKCFRKDMRNFDPETDEFCPYCDNHFVLEAVSAESKRQLVVEIEGSVDMLANRDDRVKRKEHDPTDMAPSS